MSSVARVQVVGVVLVTMLAMTVVSARAFPEDGAAVAQPTAPSYIVLGFVGGFVRHDNPHHGPVQFAERLRHTAPKDTLVQVFENRKRRTAYNTILRLLDRNHDGILSADEKAQARIILYGHSWGGSAVVLLARELDRAGIPVQLTVQVDSVAKFWQKDGIIPENVAAAVNFYQPHGIIHGRAEIAAADTSKTQILGNFRHDYNQTPVRCEGYSWLNRTFMRGHVQSECDPGVWDQVQAMVLQRIQPQAGVVAAIPQQ